MKNTGRLSVLSMLVLTALCAQAQWRSVHAIKTTTVQKILANGSTSPLSTTASEYFRSVNGSELTVTLARTPDGTLTKKLGTLYDSDVPAQYSLDYAIKTAYLIVRMPSAIPFRPNRGERVPELQHATYDGLDCVLLPIMLSGKRVGTSWIEDKDDLELKSVLKLPGYITTISLSNVTFDPKLNPEMFQVPSGFAIDTSKLKTIPSR